MISANESVWQRTFESREWIAPENEEVWTKIDDEHGERNIARLTRKGNFWFTHPKDGMYVYYMPTHWRR